LETFLWGFFFLISFCFIIHFKLNYNPKRKELQIAIKIGYNQDMQKVAIFSVKGGVGKSTVSAGLCYALRDKGYKVGYLEVDISGTSGHRAFGIDPPRLGLDTKNQKLIPPIVSGIRMFPLASKFTESACVGWRSSDRELQVGGEQVIDKGRTGFIEELLTRAIDWEDTEWLVLDLPPSTSDETFAFFDCLPELCGVILISQPSAIAVVGLRKTIDFLKGNQKPILGLVENMGKVLCPYCSQEFYSLASQRIDLVSFAKREGIPFLVSIPQVSDMSQLKPYFDELADKAIRTEGKVLKQNPLSAKARLERALIKKGLGL